MHPRSGGKLKWGNKFQDFRIWRFEDFRLWNSIILKSEI